jgi:hypothetical protein
LNDGAGAPWLSAESRRRTVKEYHYRDRTTVGQHVILHDKTVFTDLNIAPKAFALT